MNGAQGKALQPKDVPLLQANARSYTLESLAKDLVKELEKGKSIHYFYSTVDSLSSSYSMFKLFYDLCATYIDVPAMHDYIMTPEGICIIVAEALFLVGFSFLATFFDNENKKTERQRSQFKLYLAALWGYFRKAMKALKNAYKGWRSTVMVINLLSGLNVSYLIVPLGVGLGVVFVVNQMVFHWIIEKRKKMKKANQELLSEIKKCANFTLDLIDYYTRKIQRQKDPQLYFGFFCSGLGGFIDGLYNYVGVLSVAVLAPQVFIAMAVLCVIYVICCTITRMYEEYEYQLELFIQQTECELHVVKKQIEFVYNALQPLKQEIDKTTQTEEEIHLLENKLLHLMKEFDKKRTLLARQKNQHLRTALLLGLKNGLYIYSVITSVLFVAAAICFLTSTAFPPLLLIIPVVMGLGIIIGFLTYSVTEYCKEVKKRNKNKVNPTIPSYEQLMKVKEAERIHDPAFLESIAEGAEVSGTAESYFSRGLEVMRSFFSGVSKGQKFTEFAGNPLLVQNDKGEYRDPPLLIVFVVINALFFGVILALKALIKGFKEDKKEGMEEDGVAPAPTKDVIDPKPTKTVKAPKIKSKKKPVLTKTETAESKAKKKPPTQSPSVIASRLGLFASPPQPKDRLSSASPSPALDAVLDLM